MTVCVSLIVFVSVGWTRGGSWVASVASGACELMGSGIETGVV